MTRRAVVAAAVCAAAWGCGGEDAQPLDAVDGGHEVATDAAGDSEAGSAGEDAGPDSGDVPGVDADADAVAEVDVPTCVAGSACDDGDPCTDDDRCDAAGGCAGTARSCDDGLSCTVDSCAAGACEHALSPGFCLSEGAVPTCVDNLAEDPDATCRLCDASGAEPGWKLKVDGAPCDDGDACTPQDRCELGVCKGSGVLSCTTTNPCAEAVCEPAAGCVDVPSPGPCDDGNGCTGPDTCVDGACVGAPLTTPCDDGDACTLGDACSEGACVPGAPDPCDDGDPCTDDACVPPFGCQHDAASHCDDGDACTVDTCDALGACDHAAFEGPCEDGDLCTVGEECAAGTCAGGEPADCDDANPCTADSCASDVGCRHLFISAPCDDGVACTSVDTCVTGACFGAKTASCPFCPPPVSQEAGRIEELAVGVDGMPGSGLDVDGDAATCAPVGECSAGIDNALAFLALFNDTFASGIDDGLIELIADFGDASLDGAPFFLPVYNAVLADSNPTCDSQTTSCSYRANQSSFDASCRPFFSFDDARIEGSTLTAGGVGSTVTIALPFQGSVLAFTLANARLEATVTLSGDGEHIVMVEALVGGAAPKDQLIDAIAALDENVLPLPPEQLASVLDAAIDNDIDLDGDGVLDAASAALHIRTAPAELE
ncbi:MAG: hypothetical protein H6744_15345 [Deltaproteobacteria bacterium]|nr:hypothetical protein [Deltaproteobacteria bacterium]MCB9788057.1 hypothetical protein [Deltaproteobacteria bacterium]